MLFCWIWQLRHWQTIYLVTGDKRSGLLQLGKIKKARIVTAAQFCHDILKL